MEPIKKNRLKFESVEPETNPNVTQYETDEYSTMRVRRETSTNYLPWALFFLLLELLGFIFLEINLGLVVF